MIQDLEADGIPLDSISYVTQYPGFNPLCLQKWSLKLAADKYKTRSKIKYMQQTTTARYNKVLDYLENGDLQVRVTINKCINVSNLFMTFTINCF